MSAGCLVAYCTSVFCHQGNWVRWKNERKIERTKERKIERKKEKKSREGVDKMQLRASRIRYGGLLQYPFRISSDVPPTVQKENPTQLWKCVSSPLIPSISMTSKNRGWAVILPGLCIMSVSCRSESQSQDWMTVQNDFGKWVFIFNWTAAYFVLLRDDLMVESHF